MEEKTSIKRIKEVIQAAMALPKCRVCGCMKKSLETVKSELSKIKGLEVVELLTNLESAIEKMEPIQYT